MCIRDRDYLWTTYGSYKVSNEVDTENDSIPTSSAIRNYITSIGEGITELDSEEIDGYKIKIIGKNHPYSKCINHINWWWK